MWKATPTSGEDTSERLQQLYRPLDGCRGSAPRPRFQSRPKKCLFFSRTCTLIRVTLEGDFEGEPTCVTFKDFLGSPHEWPSQKRLMSFFVTLPARFHLFRSSAGTSIQPTG